MLQSFLLPDGLDAGDIEMLCILGAAFMPSIVGLLLAFFALWLPEDGISYRNSATIANATHRRRITAVGH